MRKTIKDVPYFMGDSILRCGFTHALRMPLATVKSRPYLEHSLRLLKSDPVASRIHPAAFAPPDMQYLSLGSLCLPTADAKKRAIDLLESLKLDDTLYQSTDNEDHSAKTLQVSVSGLLTPGNLLASAYLYVSVMDHTRRLYAFIQNVQKKFISANLMVKSKREATPKPILHTPIIRNKMVRSRTENTSPHVQRQLKGTGMTVNRLGSWDLRNLYSKYRDHTWAANFALERLCIAEVKSMEMWKDGEIIGRGCPELASVPLPGIKHLEQEAALTNITYKDFERIFI